MSPDSTVHPATGYRPEVDGLRAYAIGLVLAFHLGLTAFAGGFIGVDVFFVISGYVITHSLLRDLERNGRIRFGWFLLRRARRLLPAYLAVLALTAVGVLFVFTTYATGEYAKSLYAALFSVSNLHFWWEAGYFDGSAASKPLLHTWSLGVEAQFYILWPFMVAGAAALFGAVKRWLLALCLAAGALSLLANLVFENGGAGRLPILETWLRGDTGNPNATIFFWMPFRIFEFAIGAGLVAIEHRWRLRGIVNDVLVLAALGALILLGMTYSEDMVFPSVAALWPCLATAVLILSVEHARFAGILFRLGPVVWIGVLSYSIYLVHWPVIVLWQYAQQEVLGPIQQIIVVGITVAVSAVLFHLVEKPIRSPRADDRNRPFAFGIGGALAGVFALASLGLNDSFMQRQYPPAMRDLALRNFSVEMSKRNDVRSELCVRTENGPFSCLDPDRPNGLVVGNSHGIDGVNIMRAIFGDTHEYALSGIGGCPPLSPAKQDNILDDGRAKHAWCVSENKERFDPTFYEGFDYVVVSAMFNPNVFTVPRLEDYLGALDSFGVEKVIVVGNAYKLREDFFEYALRRGRHAPDDLTVEDIMDEAIKKRFRYNEEIKTVCEARGCFFLDKSEALCDGDGCLTVHDGIPFTWDKGHMSFEFAELIGRRLAEGVRDYLGFDPQLETRLR